MCRDGYHRELELMRHQKQRSLGLGKEMSTGIFREKKEEKRTVDGNAHKVANFLNLASGQADGSEIPEDQVVVASASLESISMGNESRSQSAGVGNNLFGIRLKLGLRNLEESSGDGGDSLQ